MPALEVVQLAGAGVEGARLLSGAGALALLLHEVLEALLVHAHVPLRRHLTREVEGKAVGVVQLEGDLGRQLRAGVASAAQRLLQDAHALVQGAAEAHFLFLNDAHDLGPRGDQLRIRRAHLLDHVARPSFGQKRLVDADGTPCCTARRMMRRST